MTTSTLTAIAGYGAISAAFSGPAAELNLAQATPSPSEAVYPSGANHGISCDGEGNIYVAATVNNVVGRISAPETWTVRELGDALGEPTGALPWRFWSPSNAVDSVFEPTTTDGKSAIHWTARNVVPRTVLYLVPKVFAGATATGSITVVGSGTVFLDIYNGSSDAGSAVVELSNTPQTLTVGNLLGTNSQLQIRSPSNQPVIDVTAWGASLMQSERTGIATPVAGIMNEAGFGGDNGAGEQALLRYPTGIAVDQNGQVIAADTYNNRIRTISRNGMIQTIAGTGSPGYNGDRRRAAGAMLNYPHGIAAGPDGTIYVADTYNNRIRTISRSGMIQTIAGTGSAGYSGDGGPATRARLNHPIGIAAGPDGTIYVADTYNNRIRTISRSGMIQTTAGTGSAGYSGDGGAPTAATLHAPNGIVVDANGATYIADTVNNVIRRISGGVIDTVVGSGKYGTAGQGGPALSAELAGPYDVAVDNRTGDIYVGDNSQGVLRITNS